MTEEIAETARKVEPIMYKAIGTVAGIVFTVAFTAFVGAYVKQGETLQLVLTEIASLKTQVELSEFPKIRADVELAKSDIKQLDWRISRIEALEGVKGERKTYHSN